MIRVVKNGEDSKTDRVDRGREVINKNPLY